MTSGTPAGRAKDDLTVTTEIEADRTVVVVEGTRDVAVVVNSVSGERVYLPPETAAAEGDAASATHDHSPYDGIGTDNPYEGIPTESPYEGIPTDNPYEGISTDSPYEGIPTESPYEGISTDSPYEGLSDDGAGSTRDSATVSGVVPTRNGFRVLHPEPATDVRFLR